MKRKLALLLALLAAVGLLLCACADRSEIPAASGGASASVSRSEEAAIREDGQYTAPKEVAAYLHEYGKLPGNFITKTGARKLGWDSGRDLWDYAPGKSIGGGAFGNFEGALPDGTAYRECDVNYAGGRRGAERIVYGEDGSIWYTADHYETFTRLY